MQDDSTEGVLAVAGERYHTAMQCGGCQAIVPVDEVRRAKDPKSLDRWGRPLYLCRACQTQEGQAIVDAEAVRRRHHLAGKRRAGPPTPESKNKECLL